MSKIEELIKFKAKTKPRLKIFETCRIIEKVLRFIKNTVKEK